MLVDWSCFGTLYKGVMLLYLSRNYDTNIRIIQGRACQTAFVYIVIWYILSDAYRLPILLYLARYKALIMLYLFKKLRHLWQGWCVGSCQAASVEQFDQDLKRLPTASTVVLC